MLWSYRRKVKRLAKRYSMTEGDIREMLAFGEGKTKGDVKDVREEDIRRMRRFARRSHAVITATWAYVIATVAWIVFLCRHGVPFSGGSQDIAWDAVGVIGTLAFFGIAFSSFMYRRWINRKVKQTAEEFGMPESYVRQMLAIEAGIIDGDVIVETRWNRFCRRIRNLLQL